MGANDTVWYRYLLQGTDQNWSEETTNTISKNYRIINLSRIGSKFFECLCFHLNHS